MPKLNLVGAMFVACCSCASPNPVGTVIASDGGSFDFASGAARLEVPAGALATSTEITVTPSASACAARPVVRGTCFSFSPDGLRFARSAQLTLRYDAANLAADANADLLRLYRFTSQESELVLESRVDRANSSVHGKVDRFSAYGLAVPSVAELVSAIQSLAEQVVLASGDERERLEQDLSESLDELLPIVEAQCVRTNLTREKKTLVEQLVALYSVAELVGIDCSSCTVLLSAWCGGVLSDLPEECGHVEFSPADSISLLPGDTATVEATIYGPAGETLIGELIWSPPYNSSVASLNAAATSTSAVISALEPGTASVWASSADFNQITGALNIEVRCKDSACADAVGCTTDRCTADGRGCDHIPDDSKCASGETCDVKLGCRISPVARDAGVTMPDPCEHAACCRGVVLKEGETCCGDPNAQSTWPLVVCAPSETCLTCQPSDPINFCVPNGWNKCCGFVPLDPASECCGGIPLNPGQECCSVNGDGTISYCPAGSHCTEAGGCRG